MNATSNFSPTLEGGRGERGFKISHLRPVHPTVAKPDDDDGAPPSGGCRSAPHPPPLSLMRPPLPRDELKDPVVFVAGPQTSPPSALARARIFKNAAKVVVVVVVEQNPKDALRPQRPRPGSRETSGAPCGKEEGEGRRMGWGGAGRDGTARDATTTKRRTAQAGVGPNAVTTRRTTNLEKSRMETSSTAGGTRAAAKTRSARTNAWGDTATAAETGRLSEGSWDRKRPKKMKKPEQRRPPSPPFTDGPVLGGEGAKSWKVKRRKRSGRPARPPENPFLRLGPTRAPSDATGGRR